MERMVCQSLRSRITREIVAVAAGDLSQTTSKPIVLAQFSDHKLL